LGEREKSLRDYVKFRQRCAIAIAKGIVMS